MLKTEINDLLKEENRNYEVKWKVTKNRDNSIMIRNDYTETYFEIKTFEDNTIAVKDLNTEDVVCYLFKDEYFQDYTDHDDGIRKAICKLVNYFYRMY